MAHTPTDASRARDRGRQWRKRRAVVLSADPVCAACGVREAREVDHVTPLHQGGTDSYDNLQALCHDCHAVKSRVDMGHRPRVEFGTDGLPMSGHRWADAGPGV